MKRRVIGGSLVLSASMALLATAAGGSPVQSGVSVGDVHIITESYTTAEQSSGGSSSSSRGQDSTQERVIALRDGGVELEFDLPSTASAAERKRIWQLPARVFRPANGPLQLLNADELDARLSTWLTAAGWDRSMCGRTIFTWNVFTIACDPKSVLAKLASADVRFAELREGASYSDPLALAPGVLTRQAGNLVVKLQINPAAVQRSRAEGDVTVGEVMKEPVTLEAALAEQRLKRVAGTMTISFDTDGAGGVNRRVKKTVVRTAEPNGDTETQTSTEILERRRIK